MARRRQQRHFKDHVSEARLFTARTLWSLAGIFILIAIVISRLFYLQVSNHDHYTTLSLDNRVKVIAIAPNRGLIYDRNGVILAENLPSWRLEITPERVGDMEQLLTQLQALITIDEDDIERFNKLLQRKRSFDNIPLRFHLNDEEVARIAAIQHRLPGAEVVAGLTRHYPITDTMFHVLGYVGRIGVQDLERVDATNYRGTSHIGKTGIEKQYEDILHGRVGNQQVETNAQGKILRTLQKTPPVPGQNLYLTLDARLQETAEKALDDYNGAVVAMDPYNGDILALVSKPGYDPNAFVNGISTKDYTRLNKDPDRPQFNRAIHGQYPPGSTLKPFVGLAGLMHDITHEHHTLFCPGFYTLPNDERKYRDWKKTGHGSVDLMDSIVQSCDVYFYDLARNLGIDRITPFLDRFGFGARTGIDLPHEKPGLLPSREWKRERKGLAWYPGETLNVGIGQGDILATPLQLASATSALALRGKRVQPRIVGRLEDPLSRSSADVAVVPLPPVTGISAQHWDYIIEAMKQVVHNPRGTGRRIRSDAYTIAGKTGTAQVFGIKQEEEYDEETVAKKLRDHALFISFAPVENPEIVVVVVVENGGHGGAIAAPVAGKVIEQYMTGKTAMSGTDQQP